MARSLLRRFVVATTVTTLVVGLSGHALAVSDLTRARRAAAYIAQQQRADGSIPSFSAIGGTADAVLAFVAAGRGREPLRDALAFLRRETAAGHVKGIGLKAKVALAVEAAGKDPHAWGGRDLVGEIAAKRNAFGHYKGASVLDQALGALAIEGANGTLDLAATGWLRRAQCPDGGWQYDRPYDASTENAHCKALGAGDSFRSDSNTTAYVVMALVGGDPATVDPFGFFDTMRDATYGGWGYTKGYTTTDANSTALVIQAYLAAGAPLPAGAMPALRHLQYGCGAVAYSWNADGTRTGHDVGASVAAAPAFAGVALPFSRPVSGALDASTCKG